VEHDGIGVDSYLFSKAGVLISDPCSDPMDEVPQNASSDAKRAQKCAAILKN